MINEEIMNHLQNDEEDYEFERIKGNKWVKGKIIFTIELMSGKKYEVPFSSIKRDIPIETARYIKNDVTEENQRGPH